MQSHLIIYSSLDLPLTVQLVTRFSILCGNVLCSCIYIVGIPELMGKVSDTIITYNIEYNMTNKSIDFNQLTIMTFRFFFSCMENQQKKFFFGIIHH